MPFLLCFEEIAPGNPPLDVVIRHYRMDHVIRTAFRHVAIEASRVASHSRGVCRGMALPAYRAVVFFSPADRLCRMRIVARRARHLACSKAGRFAQSVSRVDEFE